jgi:uncharacterized membrane protein YuzA (DUF378 family)
MSTHAQIHMLIVAIVLFGGLNWGAAIFGYNLVEQLEISVNELTTSTNPIAKVVYGIVGLCSVYLALQRDTWLPFLGPTIVPMQLLTRGEPNNATTVVEVNVEPNQNVLFWAALPKGDDVHIDTAYGDYSNSGLVTADNEGVAKLHLIEGNGYHLPNGRRLSRHVHYRVVGLEYGRMGPIYTVDY